tara:strand:- start:2157 stop:3680 length:1524 start_codon:yes stop_codon:yes gene_type:complete
MTKSSSALITDPLAFWAAHCPDRPALVMGDRTVSFGALELWTNGVAAAFAASGVSPGDVVVVTGANSLEWIAGALGALKAGAVVAPLNQRSVSSEFDYLLGTLEPKLVLADQERLNVLQSLPLMQDCKSLAIEAIADIAPQEEWTTPRVSGDSPAVLAFTSGSTGHPKGVIHTHATILASRLERQMIEPSYREGMRQLLVLPLYALPGTISGFIATTIHGGTLIVEPGFDPARALAKMEEFRVTAFQGPPILWEQISREPEFENADLSSLESCQVGGAPIPHSLLVRWREKGVLLRQLYGMTEVCGGATVSTDTEIMEGADTCGRGGPFTRVRIVSGDGNEQPPGVPGDVMLRGPSCTPGYWKNQKATSDLYVDGWMKTGDIGVVDDTGCFKFVDRAKDLIISGGINISPAEIERVLSDYSGVNDVAVIAASDPKFGETPAALVFGSKDLDVVACIKHCCEHLSDYKVPRYLILVEKPLPRMAGGKVNKVLLRQQYTDIPSRHSKVR